MVRLREISGGSLNRGRKAYLLLEDGSKFHGVGFGCNKSIGGEVGKEIISHS